MKKLLLGLTLLASMSSLANDCNIVIDSSDVQGIKRGKTIVSIENKLAEKGFTVVYESQSANFILTLESGQKMIEQGGEDRWYNNLLSLGGVSATATLENSGEVIFQRTLSEKAAFAPMDKAQKLLKEAVNGVPACN